jgi:hypothetical protein
MARSCSGNLRLYGTIPPHGLPLLYLEGGTLGCGAFSWEKSSIQDRWASQTATIANQKGRHKQQMYQSQFLENSIALESFHIARKICRPRRPPGHSGTAAARFGNASTGGLDSAVLFMVVTNRRLLPEPDSYPRLSATLGTGTYKGNFDRAHRFAGARVLYGVAGLQVVDFLGSVIGDRTRTLRLESGLPGPQRDQQFSGSAEGRMTISCSVYAGLSTLISQNLRP